MLFNNREVASGLWLAVFLIWALSHDAVRGSLRNLLTAALKWKILFFFGLMALYTGVVVLGLNAIGFWTQDLAKDTILWFLFSGLVFSFELVTEGGEKGIFKPVLRGSVRIIILIEFLIGAYTFALPVELILVPFVASVAATDALAKAKEKHADVAKVTTGLQVLIGLIIIISATARAVADLGNLATLDSLRQILLAPTLSLLLVPFLYVFVLITRYEVLFVRIGLGRELDNRVKRYAVLRLIGHLRLSISRVNRFLRTCGPALMRIQSEEDVDQLIVAKSQSA